MKVTLNQLRELIRVSAVGTENLLRETIQGLLLEMPLAAIHPAVVSPEVTTGDEFGDDYNDAETRVRKRPQKIKQHARYFAAPKYKKAATKLYRNLSVPIHVLPIYQEVGMRTMTARYGIMNPAKAEVRFEHMKLPQSQIDELVNSLQQGHAIIGVESGLRERDFFPTPWMIVHSFMDSMVTELPKMEPIVTYVSDAIEYGNGDSLIDIDFSQWYDILTMKSARDKNLNGEGDVAAEILTQAILDSRGFRYNPTGNSEIDVKLEKLAQVVSGARSAFESDITGKYFELEVDVDL